MISFLHSMMTRGEVEVDSIWTMHQWDLICPLGHVSPCPPFLQIQVSCCYSVDLPPDAAEEGMGEDINSLFDETLRLDDCCVVGPQHCVESRRHRITTTASVSGVIDILLHPVYAVPSPYIRLWDHHGNLLQLSEVQDIIARGQRVGTAVAQQSSSSHDNRVASMKTLVMDMHPMLDITCYTLHICKLRDIMELMLSGGDGVVKEATATNSTVGVEVRDIIYEDDDFFQYNRQSKMMYCLNWLSLVGPSIGFMMRPVQYEAALRCNPSGHL